MNISYNWLRELTDVSLPPQELARRLTMVGLAVDGVEEAGDDFVLEIDLTSNRPDCLSHLGVAREVAAMTGGSVRLPVQANEKVAGKAKDVTSVAIEDASLCPRYAARVVRGVKIAPSPEWLVRRLQAIGQRSINNVADITNFVMHELGQPLHAFDLATLVERRIVVRRARAGEKLKTLDGVERELDADMLVIADASRAVAIAGVMGGEATEISDSTTDVLIESAYFDPQSVRRTSKVLGLQTEASYRFERGVDYDGVRRAQDRCVALICAIAGGEATEDALDVYPRKIEQRLATLRPRRVEALTGLRADAEDCARILAALGFERSDPAQEDTSDETPLSFVVPSWRTDVSIEEDLVEEVARHIGYEEIGESLPPSPLAGEYLKGDRRRRAARQVLSAEGFNEAINFSFIDEANEGRIEPLPGFVKTEGKGAFVKLSNPVTEGARLMRPSLLPGLLESVRRNFNYGTRDVRLFETGHVFAASVDGEERPNEIEAFALVITGAALEAERATGRELDLLNLKGALEAACDAMRVGELEFAPASVAHLREGQSARVSLGGAKVGTLGRLSDELAAEHKFRQPVYVAEINLSALLDAGENPILYAPLPRFPSVMRDVSLVADRRVTFGEMRRTILDLGIEECRGVLLIDVYEGANVPEGKRSLTLRIEYRGDDRTLRDEDVDVMHARLVGSLESKHGAQLRG